MARVKTPDGIFDSHDEYVRYLELRALERAGEIQDLQTQVEYELVPKTDMFRAMKFTVDFLYKADGKLVAEDVKGYTYNKKGWRSLQYRIYVDKKKLLYWRFGVYVHDVKIVRGKGVVQ
jgi:hypothetical protein